MKQILNKLKEINKTIFVGIAILVVFLVFVFYYSQNNVDTAKRQEPNDQKYYISKELGFSFVVSDGFTVLLEDKELGWIVVVKTEYARKKIDNPNKEEPLDAVIISARKTSPDFPAISWLKSSNSGYNFEFGFKETVIDGEKAYMLDWNGKGSPDGALFDNPDKTLRFSVVTFGSSPSEEITIELENILKSFSFNK